MSRVNLNAAPYYDDTTMSKRYYQLLAKPGRVAQAREITALQTTLREIIKSVGDSILKNGDIVEGCQVIVSGTTVTVTSGKIYIDGIVMPMVESSVVITGNGTEIVGVRLDEDIVDESIDNTLRDPAQGYDNYNQPGCDRLRRTLTLVVNDTDAAEIATFVEGSLQVENYSPNYDVLNQTLARRTYDESGSYLVEGLNTRVEAVSESQYNVVVEAGKAYVLGYELKIPAARRILTDKSLTSNTVTASNYIYDEDVAEYLLDNDPYVKSITSVIGRVSKEESQTITSNVDSVLLDEVNVVQVVSVIQGGTEYTVGTSGVTGDCYLVREGTRYYLKWNGTATYPESGTSYIVNYEYNKEFTEETDYALTVNSNGSYLNWVTGGQSPLDNTTFTITYEQYLARKDIVYMDRYGAIDVLKGVPAESGFEVAPVAPLNTLLLSQINNSPSGSVSSENLSTRISVENIGLKRFTMNDIQGILNRIRTMEYDQAVLALNESAKSVTTTNAKKGIFTDPLIDVSRIDFYFNKDSAGDPISASLPTQDMAFDLISSLCYLPIITHHTNMELNTAGSTAHRYGHYLTLATSGENVVLSQMNATKPFMVNPYSMFPQIPEISVSPSSDIWYDDSFIEIPISITNSQIVSMSAQSIDVHQSGRFSRYSETTTLDTQIGTRVSDPQTREDMLSSEAITYMRQKTLTITGKDFAPNLDNIKCYFDGKIVSLTPGAGTIAGTSAGSVMSDNNGSFVATLTIPEGVRTGTREISMRSDTFTAGYVNEGFTLYTAEGFRRTFERTIETVTTILVNRETTTTTYIDPVGQTFVLDRLTLVKGIDVYFESKPTTNTPIICELRGVTNGIINEEVYAHKSMTPSSVNVSEDAQVATRFNFENPVLLEENKAYAFVLRSVSDDYRVWVSELGGEDVSTGETVLKNSYMTGVMLSSSNNATWTAHQTMDLKFRIVEDIYQNNSVAMFTELTSLTTASRLHLAVKELIPVGTTVNWSYSVDRGVTYTSITPYNLRTLNGSYSNVLLKAVLLNNSAENISPMIDVDTVLLTDSYYKSSGCYISKNVTGLDTYTDVKVVVETYKPSGTSLTFKISKDNGVNLVNMTEEVGSTTLNYGWKEVTYTATVASATQFRIFIEATSSTEYLTPAFRKLRCIMS